MLGTAVFWQASENIMRKVRPPPRSSALCVSCSGLWLEHRGPYGNADVHSVSSLVFLMVAEGGVWGLSLSGRTPSIHVLTLKHQPPVSAGHSLELCEQSLSGTLA